jgi:hypothetical protein
LHPRAQARTISLLDTFHRLLGPESPCSNKAEEQLREIVGSAHSLASTAVFHLEPLPRGASAELPSSAADIRLDWTRSAGFLIGLAMVPLISAALSHSKDSRILLNSTSNQILTVEK